MSKLERNNAYLVLYEEPFPIEAAVRTYNNEEQENIYLTGYRDGFKMGIAIGGFLSISAWLLLVVVIIT